MKVIDLTHEIKTNMQVFPGDPEVEIKEALTHKTDYCHVDRLLLGSHSGTHIDAPYHFLEDGKRISDYPLSRFMGDGVVIDLQRKKAGEAIQREELKVHEKRIHPGDLVILKTGWCETFGTERYLEHPYLTADAARFLVEKKIGIIAIDFLNVDPTLWESWEAHPVFLSADVLIVENINHSLELEEEKQYWFCFAPLKLADSDGAPIRAFAVEK